MAKSIKSSTGKKTSGKRSYKKRGPKKSKCKKTMPKRRYQKRSMTKSPKKSPTRRSAKCQTGMRRSPPPKGYEIICGRVVKACGPDKVRNANGRCVDKPAVKIAKILKKLTDEGKNPADYEIDVNTYKVYKKIVSKPWVKRDKCGKVVVNWKAKFMCGEWGMDPYTLNGEEVMYSARDEEKYADLEEVQPDNGFVWKTSGKCGWPEKVEEEAQKQAEPEEGKKKGCPSPTKPKNYMYSLSDFAE